MKVVTIIQARVASKRLPAKALKLISGKPMLWHVVNRVKEANEIGDLIIATTTDENDDRIIELCEVNNWKYHRGITGKVYEQFCEIGLLYKADIIVRITADCPLIDSGLIDKAVSELKSFYPDIDYVSNVMPRTYPRGLDVEVIKMETLNNERESTVEQRAHVTLHLRQNPERYKIINISNDINYSYMRWTVDTAEDFEFVKKIYSNFNGNKFDWMDVVGLLELNQGWVIKDNAPILEKI